MLDRTSSRKLRVHPIRPPPRASAPLRRLSSTMLRDIRVLDLSDERGFLAGKILADLGADVIKIERPGGDPARDRGPFLKRAEGPERERSLPWLALNTSKRGVTLDYSSDRGREIMLALVATSDVVLESFAPGTLEQLGLGFETLAEHRPGLVVCALTPFGQTGPYADHRGHDLSVVAMGGNSSSTGDPSRPPIRCTMPTSYFHAAPEAVLGILTALYAQGSDSARDNDSANPSPTPRALFVDVSMQECQMATLLTGPGQYAMNPVLRKRTGARLGRTREVWQAKDGYISFGLRGGTTRLANLIATVEYMRESGAAPQWLLDYDWQKFNSITIDALELEKLEQAFGAFFRSKSMRELYDQALVRRILLAPCNDAREILTQVQLRDRNFFVTIDYPELGASIEHPRFFALSNRFELGVRGPAARIGQHNSEVFGELGIRESELNSLCEQGVV